MLYSLMPSLGKAEEHLIEKKKKKMENMPHLPEKAKRKKLA